MSHLFNIVTLFPEFFESPLNISLMGKAVQHGLLKFNFVNPRDFSPDRHRHVDDKPFGGGSGMVLQALPLYSGLKSIANAGRLLLMSPGGRPFTQAYAKELALEKNLTLICGRYEGVDERITELFPLEEISVCDAVLNGGETAALTVIEAVARLMPGFMGKEESAQTESFADCLLEFPQYTRPENFLNHLVPRILLSGDHRKIREWRRQKALKKTLEKRPDLLLKAQLSHRDAQFLAQIPRTRQGRHISFCLFHYPVLLEGHQKGTSSLTNLDIHDIARISHSYGMGPFYIFTPLKDQLDLLKAILDHWRMVKSGLHKDRSSALRLVRPVGSFIQLKKDIKEYYGQDAIYLVTSASWPKNNKENLLSCADVLVMSEDKPIIICLGTAHGLDPENLPFEFMRLRPIRFLDENHLSVRSAAAILADRILGDFY